MGERILIYGNVEGGDRGGVQAVCRRLANHVRRSGHQVHLAWARCRQDGETSEPALSLPPLVMRNGWPAPRSALAASRAVAQLARYLTRVRPTVVNFHFVTAAAQYFFWLKPVFRYRMVLSVHGSDVLRPEPAEAAALTRLLPRGDALTTVSAMTQRALRRLAAVDESRIYSIPNGIDVDYWSAASASAPEAPVIVSLGRLDPVKGHDVLVRAFARVRQRLPNATLLLIGDGGFRSHLADLARELRVDDGITFAGELAAADVRARLATATVFALPSRSEGLPLALLEAMAAGLPAIATCVGGIPEVLADDTGVMVPAEDSAKMADALTALLLDSARRSVLAERGRRRATAFRADVADRAYLEVLTTRGRPATSTPVAA